MSLLKLVANQMRGYPGGDGSWAWGMMIPRCESEWAAIISGAGRRAAQLVLGANAAQAGLSCLENKWGHGNNRV